MCVKQKAGPTGAGFLYTYLFLLLVDSVCLCDWIELSFFVLFAWVFLVLVIVRGVIHVTFANAFIVAL